MTLIQAQKLGYPGEKIMELLADIITETKGFDQSNPKGTGFEDKDHYLEYIQETVDMIKLELTKLKEI